MAATVTRLKRDRKLSIQGGRVVAKEEGMFMSEGDVDEYVRGASESVLTCRERGRHMFPSIRMIGVDFEGVDDLGLLIRRVKCLCCKLAVRVERWEARGRGANVRYRPVASSTQYVTGEDGQTYLGPSGRGRMTPKMIQEAVATTELSGHTIGELRKAARRKQSQAAGPKKSAPKKAAPKVAGSKQRPAPKRAVS